MLILALVEERARHGYEIAKLIEERSASVLQFHVASLYPLLYRLEKRGLLQGRWVEKAGQRRRRYYKLTAAGRKARGRRAVDLLRERVETIATWLTLEEGKILAEARAVRARHLFRLGRHDEASVEIETALQIDGAVGLREDHGLLRRPCPSVVS